MRLQGQDCAFSGLSLFLQDTFLPTLSLEAGPDEPAEEGGGSRTCLPAGGTTVAEAAPASVSSMEVHLLSHSGEACPLVLSASECSQSLEVKEDREIQAEATVVPHGTLVASRDLAESGCSMQESLAEDSPLPLTQAIGSPPAVSTEAGGLPCAEGLSSKDSLPLECELSVPETPREELEETQSLREEGSSLHLILSQDLAQEEPLAVRDPSPNLPQAQVAPESPQGDHVEDSAEVLGGVQSSCAGAIPKVSESQSQPDLGKRRSTPQAILPTGLSAGNSRAEQCTGGEKSLLPILPPLPARGDMPGLDQDEVSESQATAEPEEPVAPSESQPSAGRKVAVLRNQPLSVEGDNAAALRETPHLMDLEDPETPSEASREELLQLQEALPSVPRGTDASGLWLCSTAPCVILGLPMNSATHT